MNLSITNFLNTNKTRILLAGLCVLFAWLIMNWFRYLIDNYFIFKGTNIVGQKEGFDANIYESKDYYNPNTS